MTKPYPDDALLRAADAVRAFEKADGMALFTLKAEAVKRDAYSVLHRMAANTTHAQYAEAAGTVKGVQFVLDIFDTIKREAEALTDE